MPRERLPSAPEGSRIYPLDMSPRSMLEASRAQADTITEMGRVLDTQSVAIDALTVEIREEKLVNAALRADLAVKRAVRDHWRALWGVGAPFAGAVLIKIVEHVPEWVGRLIH